MQLALQRAVLEAAEQTGDHVSDYRAMVNGAISVEVQRLHHMRKQLCLRRDPEHEEEAVDDRAETGSQAQRFDKQYRTAVRKN